MLSLSSLPLFHSAVLVSRKVDLNVPLSFRFTLLFVLLHFCKLLSSKVSIGVEGGLNVWL